jgi:arsenate reductase-like glutaredoxin family protein
MERHGYLLHFRDLSENRLSVGELEKLIGKRDPAEFINERSEIYRKKKLKDHPLSRGEAIRMMAKNPNLVRRPVIVVGGRVVVGYDENGMIRF